ncbi:hypothetical protein Ga0609869_002348 [Rhodovulum iodosum]|uniref:DUF6456 domain-containing protein n=1 Tax=Rhodovulum iodosum TaxID=68291 RepID=A0ABV3XW41_9RHOB|nr:DUF6456 domain-containing protein [Rhodovulum robiginosum]RSK35047.1 helix-turn-helix domain-containing protein [Rhodovulum robiginosum]
MTAGPCKTGPAPSWVPLPVHRYLSHVEGGRSLRALAQGAGCHASTVLRQVRRTEARRDDPLVDSALARLAALHRSPSVTKKGHPMTAAFRKAPGAADETTIQTEARRVLRRLNETGAFLAIARDMERAVVLRRQADGGSARVAVLDRAVAEAFALKDWIACASRGKVLTYEITPAGRAALKRMLAEQRGAAPGFAEAAAPFGDQHREIGLKKLRATGDAPAERVRMNLAESPLAALARRKDKDGRPFLAPELVAAGERLREDFEVAQMGPRITQNWDRFLTGGERGAMGSGDGPARGPAAARERVAAALRDLGPGLGDVALRCCCFLEGLETAEQRMGWSARSGKIVLRIALQRLKRHYERQQGGGADLIG